MVKHIHHKQYKEKNSKIEKLYLISIGIKKSRFRKNYPSLFDYPNEIPKHHTVDRLVTVEQEELNKRIVKQEQKATIKKNQRKKRVVNKSHHNY